MEQVSGSGFFWKFLQELKDKDDLLRKTYVKSEHQEGTCVDMCPLSERLRRQFECDLHRFEMVNFGVGESRATGQVDHLRAIKKYSRSEADAVTVLPHEILTPDTILSAVLYLIHNIMDLRVLLFVPIF